MTTFVFAMCILHARGYCAEVIEERVPTQAACEALIKRYASDRRVIVYCRPAPVNR